MEEKILDEILKTTFTLDSLKKRFLVLKLKMESKIYSSEDKKLKEEDVEWLKSFDEKTLEAVSGKQFPETIKFIENFINGINKLTIYFVFLPTEAQLKEIGTYLREGLKNPRLVFDLKIDPNLIGGCALAYNGVYKDYSLKGKISANKEKLVEEFRKYFKN